MEAKAATKKQKLHPRRAPSFMMADMLVMSLEQVSLVSGRVTLFAPS